MRALPLLVELCRQGDVAGAYLARVDRARGVERIVQCHAGTALQIPTGLEITSSSPGSFRVEEGGRVPAALAAAGVQAVTTVPVIGLDERVDHVLAIVSTRPGPVPSQAVVLTELFARLLADVAAEVTAAQRPVDAVPSAR